MPEATYEQLPILTLLLCVQYSSCFSRVAWLLAKPQTDFSSETRIRTLSLIKVGKGGSSASRNLASPSDGSSTSP